MSSNLKLSKKILKAKDRYFLMLHQELNGDMILTPEGMQSSISSINGQIEQSKTTLSKLDMLSTQVEEAFSLVNCLSVKDLLEKTTLDIGYTHGNTIRNIPIIYNDETLYSIVAQESNANKLINESFNHSIDVIRKDSRVTGRLLESEFCITDERIRKVLIDYRNSGYHFLKTNMLEDLAHSNYKQWRTIYYHTTEHYIESPKKKSLHL